MNGSAPHDEQQAKKICAKALNFAVVLCILLIPSTRVTAVPICLQDEILGENYGSIIVGHFSGDRLYKLVSNKWCWETLYWNCTTYCRNCLECAFVSGMGRAITPIPVGRTFQIWGVDIMELPTTSRNNHYVVVFQDLFTK